MTTLCRTCANEHKLGNSINLFQEHSSCKRMLMQLNELTGLNLKKCDSMPDFMCINCQQCLEQINKFRSACKDAQFTLERLNKSQVNTVTNINDCYSKQSSYINNEHDYVCWSRAEHHNYARNSSAQVQKYSEDTTVSQNFTELAPDLRTETLPLDVMLNKKDSQQETVEIELYAGGDDDLISKIPLEKNNFEEVQLEADIPYKTLDSDLSVIESDPEIYEQKMATHGHTYKKTAAKIAQADLNEPKQKTIRYVCELCGKGFGILQYFNMHVNRHKGELPFACKLCPEKFLAPRSLSRHMLKHSGIRPYSCRYCERDFLDHNTRLRHERMHTNTRPYQCRYCGKSFNSNGRLKNHTLSHTEERAFSCELCQRSFLLKKHLHTHFQSNVHKQKEQEEKITVKK